MEKDIDRINDKVNADAQAFDCVRASIIRDIRQGDVEQRLKEAETNKPSSNASIQDIITNNVEEYRQYERMQSQRQNKLKTKKNPVHHHQVHRLYLVKYHSPKK